MRNSVLSLVAVALGVIVFGAEASAATTNLGPFEAFLKRAADLFAYTRNALFVLAAFAFIVFAYGAIKDGEVKLDKIFWLVVGLVLLGVAGSIVNYFVNPNGGDNLTGLGLQGLTNSNWQQAR